MTVCGYNPHKHWNVCISADMETVMGIPLYDRVNMCVCMFVYIYREKLVIIRLLAADIDVCGCLRQ